MRYVVLIGDIVGSRKIADRSRFQEEFLTVIKSLNFKNRPRSPFMVTLGDEFQAVYSNASGLFNHIWLAMGLLYPHKVRFSIGIGDLETKINRYSPTGMDGSAFHVARDGIDFLRDQGELIKITSAKDDDFHFEDHTARLMMHHAHLWKKRRWDILIGMMAGKTVNDLARDLKVSKVTVYKNLKEGQLKLILDLGDDITKSINSKLGVPR